MRAVEGLPPLRAFSQLNHAAWNTFHTPRKRKTPVSDRVRDLFAPDVAPLCATPQDYDEIFDRFEMCAALEFGHVHEKGVLSALTWFPVGRFVWRSNDAGRAEATAWFNSADAQQDAWPPLVAGLFGGSYPRFLQLKKALYDYLGSIARW